MKFTLTQDDVDVLEGMCAALRQANPTADAHFWLLLSTAAMSIHDDIKEKTNDKRTP